MSCAVQLKFWADEFLSSLTFRVEDVIFTQEDAAIIRTWGENPYCYVYRRKQLINVIDEAEVAALRSIVAALPDLHEAVLSTCKKVREEKLNRLAGQLGAKSFRAKKFEEKQ